MPSRAVGDVPRARGALVPARLEASRPVTTFRTLALAAAALALAGCATVHTDVRTERGALLREFGREVPLHDRLLGATVEAAWPKLTLTLAQSRTCRSEQVQVFSEDVVTERTAPHAAPSIAAGASQAVLGAALFLGRGAFSSEPNRAILDAQGRYGASSRQVAVGWSGVLLAIGVPAIVAGLVELSMTGESRTSRESEQVASVREVACQHEPVDGELEFVSLRSADPLLLRTQGARATLDAQQLARVAFDAFTLDGKLVQLEPAEREKLDAFEACIHLEASKPRLEQLTAGELGMALVQARSCALTPGSDPQLERIGTLLRARREREAGPGPDPSPQPGEPAGTEGAQTPEPDRPPAGPR